MKHDMTYYGVELTFDPETETVFAGGVNISEIICPEHYAALITQATEEIDLADLESEPDSDAIYERKFDK